MRLGLVLRKYRLMSELDLRTAASSFGISAATLLRVESGQTPSGDVLAKLITWLISKNNAKDNKQNGRASVNRR